MLGVFFATSVNLTSQSLSSTLHACPLEKKRRTGFSFMPADNRFCSSCPFAQTAGYLVYAPCPYFALWCSSAVPKRPILSYCYRRLLAVYWESEKVELKFLSVGTKTYEPYYALCYSWQETLLQGITSVQEQSSSSVTWTETVRAALDLLWCKRNLDVSHQLSHTQVYVLIIHVEVLYLRTIRVIYHFQRAVIANTT